MDARFTASYSPSVTLKLTVAFFAGALFTSAGLLFWVQPLIAKMLLPLLGGAPSVWNTCMVFFQASLLAGYAYALLISQRLSLRNQAIVHLLLLPTPPHGDAVAVGYRPESVYLERTSTSLS